jgi:hypothetical protein
MSKEKQIEEMAHDLCHWWNGTGCTFGMVGKKAFCKPTPCKFDCTAFIDAERLYNNGYRKQIEGEWVSNCQTDEYICSLCGGFSPIDCEKENFYKSNFCPNCGAKMKGGAE